jgi:hypothetical protein
MITYFTPNYPYTEQCEMPRNLIPGKINEWDVEIDLGMEVEDLSYHRNGRTCRKFLWCKIFAPEIINGKPKKTRVVDNDLTLFTIWLICHEEPYSPQANNLPLNS